MDNLVKTIEEDPNKIIKIEKEIYNIRDVKIPSLLKNAKCVNCPC
jgi:hypothetical protein